MDGTSVEGRRDARPLGLGQQSSPQLCQAHQPNQCQIAYVTSKVSYNQKAEGPINPIEWDARSTGKRASTMLSSSWAECAFSVHIEKQ
jgi:hypothetical protein